MARLTIFIHVLPGMPTSPFLFADELNDALKKKHASGTYKSMVNCLLSFLFLDSFTYSSGFMFMVGEEGCCSCVYFMAFIE